MAFDAFMYFPMQASIVGEVQDQAMQAKHAFAIKSFEFGAENKIDIGSDTEGGAAGKATFKEFTIKKKTDTASCGLFHALCEGKHLSEGIIELRRSHSGFSCTHLAIDAGATTRVAGPGTNKAGQADNANPPPPPKLEHGSSAPAVVTESLLAGGVPRVKTS